VTVGFRAFLSEAAKKDARKGIAFKAKALDDLELGVFAQRLAQQLPPKSADYGDFLRRSVRTQGDVLADMKWEEWEVTKAALELGGVYPQILTDPNTPPAERIALVGKVNWDNITLPRLKAKLGATFSVPDDWKRQFGILRLKKLKAAVEQGQELADRHDRQLLGIWRTLEVQLGDEILPAVPQKDFARSRLPMSPQDRRRLYRVLTGTNESEETSLRLSPASAYDHLSRYGVDVVSDEEAKDLYLSRILQDLKKGEAFIPSSPRGSETDKKRWRDSAARSWGGFLPAARMFDPGNTPGFVQFLSGMTTRGFKTRINPSGRQVPFAYPEPEEFQWPDADDMPGIEYSIDVPSQEMPSEEVNSFYRSKTAEANAAVEKELVKPARDAVNWLKSKGWNIDPGRMDDYTQQVVVGMLNRTGSVQNWRKNPGFRSSTANMLARRYASQGWPSAAKERSGQMGRGEEQPSILAQATGSNRGGGEDAFTNIQASAANARQVIQRAVATLLDADTSSMGNDEEDFVTAIESLNSPGKTMDAMEVLDRLSLRYASVLPQVRAAVARIKRNLEPLMRKIGAFSD
jgi:hypothetical protein